MKNNSDLIIHPVQDNGVSFNATSNNFRFAAAVAGFGTLLRQSEFKGNTTYNTVLHMANDALGNDTEGYRKEFVTLVKKAGSLSKNKAEIAHISEDNK